MQHDSVDVSEAELAAEILAYSTAFDAEAFREKAVDAVQMLFGVQELRISLGAASPLSDSQLIPLVSLDYEWAGISHTVCVHRSADVLSDPHTKAALARLAQLVLLCAENQKLSSIRWFGLQGRAASCVASSEGRIVAIAQECEQAMHLLDGAWRGPELPPALWNSSNGAETTVKHNGTVWLSQPWGDQVGYWMLSGTTLSELTQSQLKILRHVESGASDKDIATVLGLSPRTVRNQLRDAALRVNLKSRAELNALWLRALS